MTDISHYIIGIKNCLVFRGRTGRSEFWRFARPQLLVTGVLAAPLIAPFVGFVIGVLYLARLKDGGGCASSTDHVIAALLLALFAIFALPLLSASTRRLHDTGRSAWWLLVALAPTGLFAGFLLLALAPTDLLGNLLSLPEYCGGSDLAVGLWYFFVLFPVKVILYAGLIGFMVLLSLEGDEGENRYGPAPAPDVSS